MKYWATLRGGTAPTRWCQALLLVAHSARVGRSLMIKVEVLASVTHKVGRGELEGRGLEGDERPGGDHRRVGSLLYRLLRVINKSLGVSLEGQIWVVIRTPGRHHEHRLVRQFGPGTGWPCWRRRCRKSSCPRSTSWYCQTRVRQNYELAAGVGSANKDGPLPQTFSTWSRHGAQYQSKSQKCLGG